MSSAASAILEDLVTALRSTGAFAAVALGENESNTAVPRANVLYEGYEEFPPDDTTSGRWTRLRARVQVRTRSSDGSEAILRVNSLCASVSAALLNDPYRGGRCRDLPIGQATELGRADLTNRLKRPEQEMTFDIRCHYVTGGET